MLLKENMGILLKSLVNDSVNKNTLVLTKVNFIFTKRQYRNVGKFNAEERALIKSIVAMLTIKRIPDSDIIKNVFDQTNKTISKQALNDIRNRIKRESYKWYKTMREGEYEYIHEFKERINEILDLQKKTPRKL